MCFPALGERRDLLLADRRRRRLLDHAARPLRLGRLLRAGKPDLAQPLGHRRERDHRVPRGARAALASPRPRRDPAARDRRRGRCARRGRAAPARRLRRRAAPPAAADRFGALDGPGRRHPPLLDGRPGRERRERRPARQAARARARPRRGTAARLHAHASRCERDSASRRSPTAPGRATEAALARRASPRSTRRSHPGTPATPTRCSRG